MERKFNPWPAGILASLGLFFCVQFFFVGVCRAHFEGLDEVEYYRQGIEYGQEIKRRERQRELGWSVEARIPTRVEAGRQFPLEVLVTDGDGEPLTGAQVTVRLERPATNRDDHDLVLSEVGGGVYRVPARLTRGAWEFEVTVAGRGEVVRTTVTRRAVDPA